ncbi:MAG: sn-glycerol-1-phosphate dehydrogenase [Oscillospiraceae bacterium]|nr:sn-glycerol-1-phosphate dehydrogenase [Oscillospiraceae bacterium]
MAIAIRYDADQRLCLSELNCTCQLDHQTPTQDVYVGTGLIDQIPDIIRRRGLGSRALLICDPTTYEVAGSQTLAALRSANFQIDLCRLERSGSLEPDERAVGEVALSIRPETEFLISVGSGSITDITRSVSYLTGRPQVCVGTAPSMDGYTSAICPLLLRGAKIHRKGDCPEIIVCDLDILRTAPLEMFQSGVGDVLGKYIAKADWVIGGIINDEIYCPASGSIALDAANKLLENPEPIRERAREGTRILIEALLLAGLTVMIIGHTRAVASVEHNIAHYWEMMQLARGVKPPAHGASVGVASLLIWPMFERFRTQNLSMLGDLAYIEALRANRLTRPEREAWMLRAFGESIGTTFMAENPEDFLTWEEQLRRVERAASNQLAIREELARLPSIDRIRNVMLKLGAPTTARELGVDSDLLKLSMRCGKDYRSRYTLLKLLDETGLLDDYLRDLPIN